MILMIISTGYNEILAISLVSIGIAYSTFNCSNRENHEGHKVQIAIAKDEVLKKTEKHDTITVCQAKFIRTLDDNKFQCLTTLNNDTILKGENYFFKVYFTDFNKDGCDDIKIDIVSNTPGECELFLFDKKQNTFVKLKDVFANPEMISGTNLYYSYERIGCSDNKWQSFLCKIENFKSIKIGAVYGNGCGGKDDGIFIYKIEKEEKEKLIKELPINLTQQSKENKWAFIKSYWMNNYFKFN